MAFRNFDALRTPYADDLRADPPRRALAISRISRGNAARTLPPVSLALMNTLLDVVGDKEGHGLAGLLDLVSDLVEDYDASHYAIEASEPKEVLRYLIEMRGLKQSDLAKIVPQSNLFAILAGKRKISATLAGKLARYFNVSPAVFVPA